jgi:hypothetical protein
MEHTLSHTAWEEGNEAEKPLFLLPLSKESFVKALQTSGLFSFGALIPLSVPVA